jgi:hypothetical protein
MKTRQTMLAILGAAAVAFVAGHSLSQPQSPVAPAEPRKPAVKQEAPSVEQIAQRMAENSATAEEHKVLEALAGTFKSEARTMVDDPENWLTSHGTSKAEWILGKRFMKVDSNIGADKELKGESLTIYGFDTRTHKYTVLGLDTFGTYWVSAEGDYDKDSKELRLVGTVEEQGQKMKFKWVVKIEDKKNTQTVLLNTEGDEWMKVSEVTHAKQ